MKLFKIELSRRRKGKDLLAHARTEKQARSIVEGKFRGWSINRCIEITRPTHFQLADVGLE